MRALKCFACPSTATWLALAILLAGTQAEAWQMKQGPLMTRWAALVDTNNPLPEYPRPQLVRPDWLSLNGIWQFQPGATNDPVPVGQTLSGEILVPFPMESAISGVMHYYAFSWYRRTLTVPLGWSGRRIILHLDAANWQATVYLNGQRLGVHKGGYDPFSYDITPYLLGTGPQELIVQIYSPQDAGSQPRGKQTLIPGGIMYTSSSGLWQPVWLEPVDAYGVSDLQIVPDVDNSQLRLTVNTYATNGVFLRATVLSNGVAISSLTGNPQTELDLPVPNANLWSPDNPFLYDLQVSVMHSGTTNDAVASYFGMRKLSLKTVNGVPEIYLNNRPCFQMGPLDQGFWPDGLYTAPTDDALKYDLEETKALGFNMLRKHIKVERQRWYYWADKLGLLVWQDMPSCNSYTGNPSPPPVDATQFVTELSRMVQTHWNSPAIMMWDIFNEAQGQQNTSGGVGQTNTAYLVQLVKSLDPSRLVNQASGGNYYGVGDVLDNHSYPPPGNPTSTTQAPVDGEYGGIGFLIPGHLWNPAAAGGGYTGAGTTNDLAAIYDSWSDNLVYYKSSSGLNAAVYTQITDVENECNGLLTYDRVLKPELARINASNQKAISARLYLAAVLPDSETQGRLWRYTTTTPPSNWYATNFDASAWNTGPAGFGTAGTPGAVVRTTWNTADIWLRQTFTLGSLTPLERAQMTFFVYHDEDCELYINGVLAGSAPGFITSYQMLAMNAAGQNALIANGTNVLAVHCHQTAGGQDIDAGIYKKVLVMNAAVVPTDFLSYWTLDETNGAIAHDSSGNGNNGTVSGAAWSSSGQVNGCLAFNGLDSYAQVSNLLSNDFTLSFWVKTTQTGGTGQWWQGRGLVDGFVAPNTNDFGAALCGNTFAFGTGNPDTTLLGTTAINDGVWHQCVASREQASGTLKLYVDGTLQASGSSGTNSLSASPYLRLGARQTGANYFGGSLDDVRLYSRVLGSNEVTALYWNSAIRSAAPTNVIARPGNNRVTLNWAPTPLGATGYDVQRATQTGGPYASIGAVFDTTFIDTSASNGTTFSYVVAAMNALGDGTNSVEVSATPSLSASLKTWFRADSLAGLTNGAAVADWPDLSGNSNDAAQNNPALAPAYVASALNGLPVVRFNAARTNYLALANPVQDDFTICCVFRSTQGSGSGTLYYQGAGLVNGEVPGVTTDFGTCLFANGQVCAGTGAPDVGVNSAPGFNEGRPHLLTFKRTKATGVSALYLDGAFAGSVTGTTSSLLAPPRLVLGAQQTLTYFFSGDLAEIKIYDSAFADADRVAEENALMQKWAVNAPPELSFASAGVGWLAISWPGWASGWSMRFATNLTPLTAWWPLSNSVVSNNGQFTVTVPMDSPARYFRLSEF